MSSSTSFGSGVMGSGPLGTAPFFDVKAIIDAVLYATGHSSPSSETTKRAAILQFVNNTYQEICMGKHWSWMFSTWDISLYEPETAGTVSLTNGDETVTGVLTDFNATHVKGKFVVDGKDSIYSVASITSALSLELETPYAGDDVSDANFKIYKTQYQLPSVVDQIRSITNDENHHKLLPLGTQEFRQLQQKDPSREGPPTHFTLMRRDVDDDSMYMEVWPNPDKDYNLHLDYSVRILRLDDSANCYPIIPDRYRVVLFYGALAQMYRYMNKVEQAALADKDFQRTFFRLQNDTQLTDSRLRFKPARNYRQRTYQRGLRRGRGFQDRYTFGRDD